MFRVRFILSLFILAFLSMNLSAKTVYGLYEKVRLSDFNNVTVKAKLDTGALTSSLGATDLEYFEKNGAEWVRFKPQFKNMDTSFIEKEVVRTSKIKIRSDDLHPEAEKLHTKRPVVLIDVCFDGEHHQIEVNLADRSRFNYPLLLGSAALVKLNAIVDPSLKFQSNKICKR